MSRKKYYITAMMMVGLVLMTSRAFGQGGPLNPSAPPGVTFKTLQEVEPRNLIQAIPFTITTPGSYYLVSNLTDSTGANGIDILRPVT